ncbi:MAG: metal ABC transporter permease [Verrucomicrobiota bacterium]
MIITEFFQDLFDPSLAFLRNALLVGLLGSVAFGLVGVLVVTRRLTTTTGAISHSLLAGIGFAQYLQAVHQISWVSTLFGALAMGLVAAAILTWLKFRGVREDTAISCLWSVGMAAGLLFFHFTPKYVDPMSYLFGDILLVTSQDLWCVLILDVAILLLFLLFQNQIITTCFDEDEARLRGLSVKWIYFLLMALISITVTLMVQIVGIVMVIALLTIPAAAAGLFTKKLWHMAALASLICSLSVFLGMIFGYQWPTGPMIILVTGGFYLVLQIVARTIT